MRAQISALPDGTYRASDFLDNDGIDDEALPLKIALDLTIGRRPADAGLHRARRLPASGRSTSRDRPPLRPATWR
ncbi:MAG: hypothetical protein ACMVO3_15960 [Thalassobaculum sp.]